LRWRLFVAHPCCAQCGVFLDPDRFVRDHIVPLADDGLDRETNTQPLCRPCHDRKTAVEGRRRFRGRNR
jgi:5-methylcytosine-specific restriction endonuclease McrA